jgi:hypothetical protein
VVCSRVARDDKTGLVFGRLTVLSRDGSTPRGWTWHCQCICGKQTVVQASRLNSGRTQSCGCLRQERAGDWNRGSRLDLVGRAFGRLIVTAPSDSRSEMTHWQCLCSCGQVAFRSERGLLSGRSTSCGCHRIEVETPRGRPFGAGPKNPRWIPDVPPENRARARAVTLTWSKAVLARDGWTCVACGSRTKLHAHHLRSWLRHPNLRFEVTNGVTACADCHRAYHRHVGRSDFSRESFFEFFRLPVAA